MLSVGHQTLPGREAEPVAGLWHRCPANNRVEKKDKSIESGDGVTVKTVRWPVENLEA